MRAAPVSALHLAAPKRGKGAESRKVVRRIKQRERGRKGKVWKGKLQRMMGRSFGKRCFESSAKRQPHSEEGASLEMSTVPLT